MEVINKRLVLNKIEGVGEYIYLPIMLNSSYSIDTYWVDDLDENTILNENGNVTLTGFCESILDDLEILGAENSLYVNEVGVAKDVNGVEFPIYDGVIENNDISITYIQNCGLDNNGKPDPNLGIIYTDYKDLKRVYNSELGNIQVNLTKFETINNGRNKLQFRENNKIYVDDNEFGFIKPIQTDTSDIKIDRKPQSIFELHSKLNTIDFI
jgi:hypothetical protein